MKINEILIRPIVTEKTTKLINMKKFAFVVHSKANKHQIKEALQTLYKIKVQDVNVIVRKGKERKVGRRMTPKKKSDTKIAYVLLKEGKLDLFPQA